jgi:UPF0176 protein
MTTPAITITAFYHFTPLQDLSAIRARLLGLMQAEGVKGTILLAPEGVNATISGHESSVQAVLKAVRALPGCATMKHKTSHYSAPPFERSMVKIKDELIGLGVHADPSVTVGKHIPSHEWNALISDPEVLLIDGRNSFEHRVGTFKGAVDLGADDFKDFPRLFEAHVNPQQHRKVAMFCTGGIRCEKLSSYALDYGIEEVYHLDGGILQYLEDTPADESLWQGECYVFDERVAVGHGLQPTAGASYCPNCGHPILSTDHYHPLFVPGIRCGWCYL